MFAQELSEALLSEMTFKPGTVRTWSDGKRVKLKNGLWIRYKAGQGGGGQVRDDASAVERAKKERAMLRSAAAELKTDWEAGNIDTSLSFGKHIELAKRQLGRHAASLDRTLDGLRELVPKGSSEKVGGPCKNVRGKEVDCYNRVSGRVKTLSSVLGKMSRKHHKKLPSGEYDMSRPHLDRADKLQDLTGTRMLAENNAAVRALFQKVKAKYGDRILQSEEMLSQGRIDGYRSLHAEFIDDDGLTKEIQIRTPNQHRWSEWSHDIYKPTEDDQTAYLDQINGTPGLRKQMDKYAIDMSDYYGRIDEEQVPGERPECPEVVSKSPFGCLD